MKSLVRWSVVAGLLVMMAGQAHAVDKEGTAAVKWLNIDTNARQTAIGSAASAYTDLGAFAALTNQAAMVFVPDKAVGFTYMPYFADMTYFSGAAVYNMGDRGAVGISFVSLTSGDIPHTTSVAPTLALAQAANLGNFTVTGLAIGPSYARRLTDAFTVGASFKVVSEGTDGSTVDKTNTTFAFDAGTIYTTDFHNFRIGATFQNFGPDMRFLDESNIKQTLPTTFRIGFAGEPATLPVGSIMLSTEIWKLRETESVLNFGAEYWVNQYISGRIGFKAGYNEGDEGVSAGAGLRFDQGPYRVNIDYSYTDQDLLDTLHRISVGIGF